MFEAALYTVLALVNSLVLIYGLSTVILNDEGWNVYRRLLAFVYLIPFLRWLLRYTKRAVSMGKYEVAGRQVQRRTIRELSGAEEEHEGCQGLDLTFGRALL
ncbi:hypothetical protein [Deinococcus planocerae]|uniref:hypothetical protein n=1 Tax=Deinococcus planocerae TaxID=1737569 RepID=UPI0011AF92AE|nr:hypothetical protein [Deinococcus planocerae]